MATTKRRAKSSNGSGGVTRRSDGRWMGRYSTTDPVTGRAVRRTVYGATEAECRAKLVDGLADRNAGRGSTRAGRTPTLAEWAESWLDEKGRELRPHTLVRYRECLGHLTATLGRLPLSKLDERMVRAALLDLHPRLRGRTIRDVRDRLYGCLGAAVELRIIARNPALVRLPRWNDAPRPTPVLQPGMIAPFLAMADGHRDGPMWVLALATGLRQSEIQGLRWADVDLLGRVVTVGLPLHYKAATGWHVQPPKSLASRRTVPLPAVAVVALQRQRAQQAAEKLAADSWDDQWGDLVFTTATGGPTKPTTAASRLVRALAAAGLPPVQFHALRRSMASVLDAQGIGLKGIQAVLGHSNPQTTLTSYVRVFERQRDVTTAALDAVLGG